MNWKQEAVDKLRKFDAMRQAVRNIPTELERLGAEQWDLEEETIRSGACKNNADVLNNLTYRGELKRTLEQARLWIKSVSRALTVLSPQEKLVLTRLYIYPEKGAVQQLCQELEMEQSTVYRKRDAALEKFTLALYGEIG